MLATVIKLLIGMIIPALMLSVGLRTDRTLLREAGARWRLLARALAVVWIGVPVVALVELAVFRPPPLGAEMLMLMAVCPGVPFVMWKTARIHPGDVTTSLLVLLATALTAPLLLPLWTVILRGISPFALTISPLDVLATLARQVFVPLAIGVVVRHVAPRPAATLAKVANALVIAGLAVAVVVLVAKAIPVVRAAAPRTMVAGAIMTIVAAVMGYLAGGPRLADRRALAYGAALGNPALALAVLAHTNPDLKAGRLLAAYIVVRALALVPFGVWVNRHRRGEAEPQAPALAPGGDAIAHARGS